MFVCVGVGMCVYMYTYTYVDIDVNIASEQDVINAQKSITTHTTSIFLEASIFVSTGF